MESWVEIIAFYDQYKAVLAKSLLEASDICAVMQDELTVQINNFYANAIGGIKLFVPQEQAKEALQILEAAGYIERTPQKTAKLEVFPHTQQEICPYCQSTDTAVKRTPGYLFGISFLLLHFPLPFLKKTCHCYDCGREWSVKQF